jgi:hypothetical protein
MATEYQVSATEKVVNDAPDKINYHINSDDYFAFLATLMGFMEESLGKCAECNKEIADGPEREIAHDTRHDLRYVQANYKIVPRPLEAVQEIKGSGNQLA